MNPNSKRGEVVWGLGAACWMCYHRANGKAGGDRSHGWCHGWMCGRSQDQSSSSWMLTRLCLRAPPTAQTELLIWSPDEQKISDLTGRRGDEQESHSGPNWSFRLFVIWFVAFSLSIIQRHTRILLSTSELTRQAKSLPLTSLQKEWRWMDEICRSREICIFGHKEWQENFQSQPLRFI